MEAKEFDATLGGAEHLPYSANSLKFAASRSVEIAAMTESILRPSKTKLIFQCLPVHMRRRVMSHNSKRLPRILRGGHLEQLKKSGLPPKQKRPSRKYRRRPKNLLEEYNRRQKKNVWLETHIWHAKRFHMTERWGYRLPFAPCDKAFRACYRGSSAHCLLQDISYHMPIQITGPVDIIKELFSKITDCACGLGICAKSYVNGARQGTVNVYKYNTYPFGYIGKVQFIWVPTNSTNKIVWLFVHPSQVKQIELLLLDISCADNNKEGDGVATKRRKLENGLSILQIKVMPGLNRFRLTGPNSHAILVQSLKCVNDNDMTIRKDKWMTLHKPTYLKEKDEYWKAISTIGTPSQLSPNMVLGLVVKDPRLSRPSYRTKGKQETNDTQINSSLLCQIPPYLSTSPLWDNEIHKTIKEEKLSNGQFIEHVTKTQLVPGEVNQDDTTLQSVPVVLVQRPGSQHSEFKKVGYGSGWDVIVPPEYALQFWMTFIMFGARSGGLRETESLAFEMGECYLAPDSESGKDDENRIETELREKYFRLPPSKKVNYAKLAINSPFKCPWTILLKNWSGTMINDFFVLRDKKQLNDIQDKITTKKSLSYMESSKSCLVAVYIKLVDRGNLKKHALICIPQSSDLTVIKTLFEDKYEDPNEKIRKQKRSLHIKMLKKYKRKKMKLKRKGTSGKIRANSKKSRQEPSDYVKSMRELWLPSNIETVRNIGSREVMGYVTQGGFSFTEAGSCGVGYIAYNALNTLLNNNINKVLVRNTTSRKYRLANISIIKNV